MSHKSPLHTLQELAHTRVDEATRHLGELMASKNACEVKLSMLQDYRKEYCLRFMQSARNGIDPRAWSNYASFIGKLDEAIRSQEIIVERSRKATEKGQEKWISEHTRAKAFDTLNERQMHKEMLRQNKIEQRQSDEHAIKHFKRQHEDGSN